MNTFKKGVKGAQIDLTGHQLALLGELENQVQCACDAGRAPYTLTPCEADALVTGDAWLADRAA